jgi:hypothetical protein
MLFIPGLLALTALTSARRPAVGYAARILILVGTAAIASVFVAEMLVGRFVLDGADPAANEPEQAGRTGRSSISVSSLAGIGGVPEGKGWRTGSSERNKWRRRARNDTAALCAAVLPLLGSSRRPPQVNQDSPDPEGVVSAETPATC